MLIEFKVTNFRSIKETQTLSMVAGNATKDKELVGNTFDSGIPKLGNLLKSAVIYGPNAAGKSNLIAALAFMEQLVVTSAKEAQLGEDIDINTFRLDSASRIEDSEFEVHFISHEIRYQYGFRLNAKRITSEWLIAYPDGYKQLWFERQFDSTNQKYEYKFGSLFKGGRARSERTIYTIENNLYLSVAVQKNAQELLPVFTWFQSKLHRILSMNHLSEGRTSDLCLNDEGKQKVLAFMNAAGIGVKDLSVAKKLFTEDDLPKDMPLDVRDRVLKELQGAIKFETKFIYQSNDGQDLIAFDLNDESDGTQALFAFAARWLALLENDHVLFVDEIDTSLHPLLVHHLVNLLHTTNAKAQLVFTTHDTTLLSQSMMRTDQVWFVEKDKQQSTQLYSLADYRPRPNEAIEARYLNGRYGAIPFLSKLDFYGE